MWEKPNSSLGKKTDRAQSIRIDTLSEV